MCNWLVFQEQKHKQFREAKYQLGDISYKRWIDIVTRWDSSIQNLSFGEMTKLLLYVFVNTLCIFGKTKNKTRRGLQDDIPKNALHLNHATSSANAILTMKNKAPDTVTYQLQTKSCEMVTSTRSWNQCLSWIWWASMTSSSEISVTTNYLRTKNKLLIIKCDIQTMCKNKSYV